MDGLRKPSPGTGARANHPKLRRRALRRSGLWDLRLERVMSHAYPRSGAMREPLAPEAPPTPPKTTPVTGTNAEAEQGGGGCGTPAILQVG